MAVQRKKRAMIGAFVFLCVFLSGCGDGGAPDSSGDSLPEERPPFDFLTEEWRGFEEQEESDPQWPVTDYLEGIGYQPEAIEALPGAKVSTLPLNGAVEGDTYYCLQDYYAIEGEEIWYEYYLTMTDTVSLKRNTVRLGFPAEFTEASGLPDLAGARPLGKVDPQVAGIDVAEGKLCVFFQQINEEKTDTIHYYAVWFDGNWNAEKAVDLLPAMQREGNFHSGYIIGGSACYGNGYYYICKETTGVLVLDGDGEFVTSLSVPGDSTDGVSLIGRLPDGSPVFEYISNGENVLFCFDGKEKKTLYQGEIGRAFVRAIDGGGSIVSIGRKGVTDWDVTAGRSRILYQGDGINYTQCSHVIRNSAGELVLVFEEGFESYLYKLREKAEGQREIRIVQLRESEFVAECAAEYSRTHPLITVTVDSLNEDADVALTKLVSDVLSGGGPDLIVLDRRELKILQEKGILADLSGVLPEELESRLFSGVLAYGTLEEKLYGLVYSASVSTLYVPKGLWEGDTWSLRDVMGLMEESGAARRFVNSSAKTTLSDVLLHDIGNSGFVDFERGECRFDTEEFCRVLEFCRQCGEGSEYKEYDYDTEDSQRAAETLAGEALAYPVEGGISGFSRSMAPLGDDFVCVGYPTEGESGSYIVCNECIAANAKTENMDVVSDFLQYLLSDGRQLRNSPGCVRRDILLSYVKDGDERSGGSPYIDLGNSGMIPLTGKKDGGSFLKEYMELMDRATPAGTEYEIQDILYEEASAYFAGDKDAETAASIIQSRVQLYLDERK